MVDQKIIHPSEAPWSASIWVKKVHALGEHKWRITIDCYRLKDITIADAYPIPIITDILD